MNEIWGKGKLLGKKKNYYIVGESLTVLASQLTSLVFTYAMVYILREVGHV